MLIISGLVFSQTTEAQTDSSGIYKTADDYKAHKLSYAINYKTEKHKIKSYFLKAILLEWNIRVVLMTQRSLKLMVTGIQKSRNTNLLMKLTIQYLIPVSSC